MTGRALVVDDDRTLAKTLSDVLRLKGWDVTTVNSGTEAVNEVARGPFDIVLIDFKMPGMDGVSAFKAIRELQPKLQVVLMSAYLAQEVVDEAEREGVLRVFSKPVEVGALLVFLADAIRRQFISGPVPKAVQ